MRKTIVLAVLGFVATATAKTSSLRPSDHVADEAANLENDAQVERLLADDSSHFMDRCGNNNPCEDGLECSSVGLFGTPRCIPSVTCIQTHMTAFQAKYDMKAIQAQVFANAGVTETELLDQLMNAPSKQSFAVSDPMNDVMESLKQLTKEPVLALHAMRRNCTNWEDEEKDGAIYAGIHVEGGLLLQASFDFFSTGWPVTNDYEASFIRACTGIELGGGADISLIIGAAMGSATYEDLACVMGLAGVDVYGITGVGLDVGIQANGFEVLQITPGLGAGLGVGFQACGTIKVSDRILSPDP